MNTYTCEYCYDKGYLEWYDRDQDGWYTYRQHCRHCKPDKPQTERLVDFDQYDHMKPESAFMESRPSDYNGGTQV